MYSGKSISLFLLLVHLNVSHLSFTFNIPASLWQGCNYLSCLLQFATKTINNPACSIILNFQINNGYSTKDGTWNKACVNSSRTFFSSWRRVKLFSIVASHSSCSCFNKDGSEEVFSELNHSNNHNQCEKYKRL